MFKKLTIILVIFSLLIVFVVSCSGGNGKKDLIVESKELKASSTNRATIDVSIKNNDKSDVNKVLLKAKLSDESGNILDEPFDLVGPIKSGETKSFNLESYAEYYKVKDFEVTIESAD